MKKLEFYEFTGIVVPGTVVLVGGLLLVIPSTFEIKTLQDVSIGGLGIGLILAYTAGHLVQSVGNLLEKVWWWTRGGMPTDWVRTEKHNLIADSQRKLLQGHIRKILTNNTFEINSSLEARHWYSITRQIYAILAANNHEARIDIFNGNYGLCRGIASSLLVLLFAVVFTNWQAWKVELILVILFSMSIYRMNRFAVHYGRELFVQFLQINNTTEKQV